MRTTAASLLNLSRNIGGSVGISVVTAQLVRMAQVAHADIASHVTANSIPIGDQALMQTIAPQGPVALAVMNAEVTRQALFIAYLDDFKLMMLVTVAVLPLLLLMKRGRRVGTGDAPRHVAMD
jgi:DHA2 family multidrug resistance protein